MGVVQRVELRKWAIVSDPDLTREAYALQDDGCAERCGCEACFNFATVRHLVYSSEVLELFDWLGIDPLLEGGLRHERALGDGLQRYTVWFYLVGQICDGPCTTVSVSGATARPSLEAAGPGVEVGFCLADDESPDVFAGLPVVRLEVSVEAPWNSNAPVPPGWDNAEAQ